uniref:Ras-GEF domain-containing protein n=1 Tax=Strigamia maritima TaxID=126957 RepID=T1J9K9_STRMM
MFSASTAISDQNPYDFENETNALKWKGLFVSALKQVQYQVHSTLTAKEDALEYVESLVLRLLGMLCAAQPHQVSDVEERVRRTFLHPIENWAISEAQSAIEKGKKNNPLVFPVEKIHPLLQKEVLVYKIDYQVSMYIVAVLEYISADILKLAGNYVQNIRHKEITCQDIRVAMCADKVLMDMFYQDEDVAVTIEDEPISRTAGTYDERIKDFLYEEKQYLRDLNMIIKVFREPFVRLSVNKQDVDIVFSNILDIYDFTVTLVGAIEDTLEMTEEKQIPTIGSCFEELAEAAEFDVYDKYAHDTFRSNNRNESRLPYSRDKLFELLQRPDVCYSLQTGGQGFKSAIKYVLPKLQLGPVYHCLQYFEHIKVLLKLTTVDEDRESLEQAEGLLRPLQVVIERLCGGMPRRKFGETSLRIFGHMSRQAALTRMNDLQKTIDGWEGKDIGQCCNEFILDGLLGKIGSGKRLTERHVFLFDGLIIMCKQNNRRTSVTGPVGEFRLKEKYFIRKIEIIDREDTDELKNAFEIAPREQPHVILFSKTAEEKNNWMAALIMLSTRSMLERTLDSILAEEEKKHPLRLPPPEIYRFAEEDSEINIVLEDKELSVGVPLIKGATLLKLVERLTFHMVLNVLRHWVDHHFYDFERDPQLLYNLQWFLGNIRGKSMRKWADSIGKIIQRRSESSDDSREITICHGERSPPKIEWYLGRSIEKFDLLTLHPIELARQLTLHEFDLYRAVKPSELVGSVWTKKNKFKTSPNLLKMIHHSTNFTLWLEKLVVETENYEERVAVVSRIIEVMIVLQDLNNFNGVLEVVSAMNSASVYRLEHTFNGVSHKLIKALEDSKELHSDHYKKYQEKLRSINPPCVPFFGMYLTNILHIEEGNPDFLPNYAEGTIINFSKRRKVAEITGEIQQYQNQPYCLSVEANIRKFVENLNPLEDRNEKEFNDHLYGKSLEIEPRNCKQPSKFVINQWEFRERDIVGHCWQGAVSDVTGGIPHVKYIGPRRFPDSYLKSPGIKARASGRGIVPGPLPSMESTSTLFRTNSRSITSDDREPHSPRVSHTPPTPSTPLTPPHSATSINSVDNSIFANVLISPTGGATTTLSPGPMMTAPNPLPPPLPPRKTREPSIGDTSPKQKQASDAPLLPPRDTSPPPLPPRRDLSHLTGGGTLPRLLSSSSNHLMAARDVGRPILLPRRNSSIDVSATSGGLIPPPIPSPPSVVPRRSSHNGPSPTSPTGPASPVATTTPQLPPRTYRHNVQVNNSSAPR